MQRKAFIAAPLIGTLIFLVAILVIINISRSESAAIAETVSDSYHNKLVSVVEIYRSDLGSVFNIGLQRNIEYALTSQCWGNFINLATERTLSTAEASNCPGPACLDLNSNNILDENEERLYVCKRSSEIMKQVVCSKPSADGTYLFSLPKLVEIISGDTSFEGITLSAANKDAINQFVTYDVDPNAAYNDLCTKIVSNVELNCNKFAAAYNDPPSNDDFECCSEFDAGGNCAEGKKVLGCEGGNQFFVRIAIQNTDVFGKFPRVLAEDDAGNKIRAGSISDADFDAPISYPFFKYLDATFRFNRILAYGANLIKGDGDGAKRGITEGSCVGKTTPTSGCQKLPEFTTLNGVFGQQSFTTSAPDAVAAYALDFGPGVLAPACKFVLDKYGLNVFIGSENAEKACMDVANSKDGLVANFHIDSSSCGTEGGRDAFCAFIKSTVNAQVSFFDPDTSKQVRASGPNKLCWYSSPRYGSE